ADAEHDEQRHLHGDSGDRHDEGRDAGDADAGGPRAGGLDVDGGDLAVGGVGGAHGAHGADGALDAGRQVADLGLRLQAGGADAGGEQHHGDDRGADHEHGQAEQHRVDDEHGDERADEGEGTADGID